MTTSLDSLNAVAKALEVRCFKTSVVPTLEAAVDMVVNTSLSETKAKSVAFGGSVTVEKSGLVGLLKNVQGLEVMDTYDRSNGLEALIELRRQALLSDLFITSANAITENGRVMLLDGLGNRTAAVQFGPRHVILIVGKNKICKDSHEAMARVRNVASVANAKRLSRKTPCVKTGKCMDCKSPERICCCWTILDHNREKDRVHVILVDQELGF